MLCTGKVNAFEGDRTLASFRSDQAEESIESQVPPSQQSGIRHGFCLIKQGQFGDPGILTHNLPISQATP